MADELTENEESVELTDEELDRIADTAISALQDILKYFESTSTKAMRAS